MNNLSRLAIQNLKNLAIDKLRIMEILNSSDLLATMNKRKLQNLKHGLMNIQLVDGLNGMLLMIKVFGIQFSDYQAIKSMELMHN